MNFIKKFFIKRNETDVVTNPWALEKSAKMLGEEKRVARILYSRPNAKKIFNNSAFIAFLLREILIEKKFEVKIDSYDELGINFERSIFEDVKNNSCDIFVVLEQFSLGEVSDDIHSHFYKELVFCVNTILNANATANSDAKVANKKIIPIYIGDVKNVKEGLINSLKYYEDKPDELNSLETYELKEKELTVENLNKIFELHPIPINAPTFNQIFVKESRDAYGNLLRAECHFQL